MIAALALLLMVPQDAGAAADPEEGEPIVVRAQYGRTTMLFDRGADGKLRNCRIMVSSGSQKRDTAACQATPVCYAGTADVVTDCTTLRDIEPLAPLPARDALPAPGTTPPLDLRLVPPPRPLATGQAGPTLGPADADPPRDRLEKLKPPPKPETGTGAVIRITNAQDQ